MRKKKSNNFKTRLLILGAGQYGMLAREIAKATNRFISIEFLDDLNDVAIGRLENYHLYRSEFSSSFVAIGNSRLRERWIDDLIKSDFTVETLIHPSSYVAPSARLDVGCIIEPMSVVHTLAVLGRGVIVSSGAVVNHNSEIGSYVHIDCNAVIPSNSIVPNFPRLNTEQYLALRQIMKTTVLR